MSILLVTHIIGVILVPIYCVDPSRRFRVEDAKHLYNTLKYTTDSVDIVLDIVKSLKLESDKISFNDYLRVAGAVNKQLFTVMENLYERTIAGVNWTVPIQLADDAYKELEHVDNYSKVMKQILAKIQSRAINSSIDYTENPCQIMPIGPRRVLKVVQPLPTRAKREASTTHQYSNMDIMLTDIEDGISVKFEVFDVILTALGGLVVYDKLEQIKKADQDVSKLNNSFRDLSWHMMQSAKTAKNLVIKDDAIKNSKTLVNLAFSIRSTMTGLK